MLSLKARTLFAPPFSLAFPHPKHLSIVKSSFSFKLAAKMSSSSSSQSVVEHVVLFKVKENTEPSKVNAMVSNLNGLVSLDQVLHITAGPVHRTASSPIAFTHALHSRYKTKDDLAGYSAHPRHVSVVKESVLPIVEDIMAVDWIGNGDDQDLLVAPPPGSALRLTFLKLKEGLGEEVKSEILGVIKGLKGKFSQIDQITCGENFSPARAKGYSLASLAVFPGVSEMEAVDSNEQLVNSQKEKVRDYLDSVVVIDYVIPPPQSASL
ncbi:hypothetical protein FH972_003021 [Carpinus fangiana]|uniref:Stress-response A/B barrel domain-containing protein n=1 Tax=Carpinus fangiana TaxID=176857 RepID=A0A5N6QH48_9ROSI|nr:hypothetical protein FH972_003021 [Carpinus fangiana]